MVTEAGPRAPIWLPVRWVRLNLNRGPVAAAIGSSTKLSRQWLIAPPSGQTPARYGQGADAHDGLMACCRSSFVWCVAFIIPCFLPWQGSFSPLLATPTSRFLVISFHPIHCVEVLTCQPRAAPLGYVVLRQVATVVAVTFGDRQISDIMPPSLLPSPLATFDIRVHSRFKAKTIDKCATVPAVRAHNKRWKVVHRPEIWASFLRLS